MLFPYLPAHLAMKLHLKFKEGTQPDDVRRVQTLALTLGATAFERLVEDYPEAQTGALRYILETTSAEGDTLLKQVASQPVVEIIEAEAERYLP